MGIEPLPTDDGRPSAPRQVGQALDAVMRRLGAPDAGSVAAVFGRWPELVGERIAGHARPVAVRRGALVVEVDDPAWATELRWLEAELLERARQLLNNSSIDRIEIRTDPAGRLGKSPD